MQDILMQIAIVLVAAKAGAEICERFLRLPAVVGELVGGILVGQHMLGWVHGDSSELRLLADIGAILLLFEAGLESDLDGLLKVGFAALWVGCCGVMLHMAITLPVARYLGIHGLATYYVSGALAATSVGISARVFGDLKALHLPEARMVMGAAVIDDVIGLVILAVLNRIGIDGGQVTPADTLLTVAIAILFIGSALLIGVKATPYLLHFARKMQTRAALSSTAVVFCLVLAALSKLAQLAPMIGSFAAGLALAKTEQKTHFEEKIRSLADLFIPIFFVQMGTLVDLHVLLPSGEYGNKVLIGGLILLICAAVGKILAGLSVPVKGIRRGLVVIGMLPRGEVSLLCAGIGLSRHILNSGQYAMIFIVVILTTLMTPLLLGQMLKKDSLPI